MVELCGIEPQTSCVQSRRSPSWAIAPFYDFFYFDLHSACRSKLVGLSGLEPPTSPLSGVRSNQLSYRPIFIVQQSWPKKIISLYFWIKQFVWTLIKILSFKEVIQPQVPLGLPCYDFTPVMNHKVVTVPPKVRLATSFATHSHGVTGGVYKARERIHRGILIHDY